MLNHDFPFSLPFRVRFAEVDIQGIVFNAHYMTYFDTAITEYLRHCNLPYAVLKESGNDFHLVKATLEYKAPLYSDDLFTVGVRVGRIGRSSVTFELAIFRDGETTPCNTGEIIWVYADMTTHKSVAISDEMRGMLLGGSK
ncbi:MAG: acyl-CoA thioesterase [Anaerolineales bacterium]|nr:acyl-CoA thioesterase [Anaerolineales bacterium]